MFVLCNNIQAMATNVGSICVCCVTTYRLSTNIGSVCVCYVTTYRLCSGMQSTVMDCAMLCEWDMLSCVVFVQSLNCSDLSKMWDPSLVLHEPQFCSDCMIMLNVLETELFNVVHFGEIEACKICALHSCR